MNDKDIKLKEEIKTIWIRNYKKYIEMEITEREFMTKAKPLPQQKHFQLIDEILVEEIPKTEEQHGVDISTLNVIYNASVVTILEKEGRLREIRRKKTAKHTPGWQIKLEARIEAIRRNLSYTYVLLKCKKQGKYYYTQHQHHVKRKMEKWYGNLTKRRLHQIQLRLKQELKVDLKTRS